MEFATSIISMMMLLILKFWDSSKAQKSKQFEKEDFSSKETLHIKGTLSGLQQFLATECP